MEKYQITVEGQMGLRLGSLQLDIFAQEVKGSLSLLGAENECIGIKDGNCFIIKHELKTAVSTLLCESRLNICDNEIAGWIYCKQGKMKIYGTKVAGDENNQANE